MCLFCSFTCLVVCLHNFLSIFRLFCFVCLLCRYVCCLCSSTSVVVFFVCCVPSHVSLCAHLIVECVPLFAASSPTHFLITTVGPQLHTLVFFWGFVQRAWFFHSWAPTPQLLFPVIFFFYLCRGLIFPQLGPNSTILVSHLFIFFICAGAWFFHGFVQGPDFILAVVSVFLLPFVRLVSDNLFSWCQFHLPIFCLLWFVPVFSVQYKQLKKPVKACSVQ